MKFWVVIWSFYFLALAAKSCMDAPLASGSTKTTEILVTHQEHEHLPDLCSPLCSCSCCGAQIVQQQADTFVPAKKAIQPPGALPSSYRFRLQSDYFGNIWQPPQLS